MVFYLSKILWAFTQPSNLAILLLSLGIVLTWTRWARAGRRITTILMILFITVMLLPIGNWLAAPLEARFPRPEQLENIDGIIVLGGAFRSRIAADRQFPTLNAQADRYPKFLELARQFPSARLVVAGGAAWALPNGATEATFARQFFLEQGLDPNRVEFENNARNTHENAVLSKQIVQPKPNEKWVLVTSAAHMPRSVGLFRKIGWEVIPYPVDYRTPREWRFARRPAFSPHLKAFDAAVKEWVGITAYFLLGRTSSIFPAPDTPARTPG